MPQIKIDKVVTFSTEDPHHPASNILSPDPSKKWKCAQTGEKSASIVLQLEKATQITGIDIGNEQSACVEVLVSRGGTDEYKPLLGMSSFMSPLEARQNSNMNKVRMFTINDLSQPERDEKWDRVKIVCIQPYNRHVQYGLSFLTIHSNGVSVGGLKKNIGKFTLRPDSPVQFSVGSIFSKEMEKLKGKDTQEVKTTAAAIREASINPTASSYKSPIVKKPKASTSQVDSEDFNTSSSQRNRSDLLYTEDDNAATAKIDKLIQLMEKKKEEEKRDEPKIASKKRKSSNEGSSEDESPTKKKALEVDVLKDHNSPQVPQLKRKTAKVEKFNDEKPGPSRTKRPNKDETNITPKKKAKIVKVDKHPTKFYETLLEGVVIVVSGIQNPERGRLRTSALAMGAKYKTDWDNTCTHLICAFANTPKFNQVRGQGKIVKKQWVVECERERKRLPWRRFALDRNDQTGVESEDEIWEKVENAEENRSDANGGSDTDDEIERIQQQNNKITNKETENGDDGQELQGLPVLPNYFSGFSFYLSSSLGTMRNELTKYIVAYNGKLVDGLEDVNGEVVAILFADNDNEADELRKYTTKLVSPTWLFECHNKKRLLPFAHYLI